MALSPTARTLAALREAGWTAEVVEQRLPIPGKFITRDFAGCIDIIAFHPQHGILGVQATGGDGGNHAARREKILAEPRAALWLASGGKLVIYSWAKRGAAGSLKVWTMRVEQIKSEDIVETVPASVEPDPTTDR